MRNYKYHHRFLQTFGYGPGAKINYRGHDYKIENFWDESNHIDVKVDGFWIIGFPLYYLDHRGFNSDVTLKNPFYRQDKVQAHFCDEYTDFLRYNSWFIGEITVLTGSLKTCMTLYDKPYPYVNEVPNYDYTYEGFKSYRNQRRLNDKLMDKANKHAKRLNYPKAMENLKQKMKDEVKCQ